MSTLRRRENVVDKEKETSPSPPSKQKGLNESKKRIVKESSQTSSKGSILTIFLIFFLLGVSARIALKLSNDIGGDDDTIQEFFPWQLQRPELSAMEEMECPKRDATGKYLDQGVPARRIAQHREPRVFSAIECMEWWLFFAKT